VGVDVAADEPAGVGDGERLLCAGDGVEDRWAITELPVGSEPNTDPAEVRLRAKPLRLTPKREPSPSQKVAPTRNPDWPF
jgi:hypothetical protein